MAKESKRQARDRIDRDANQYWVVWFNSLMSSSNAVRRVIANIRLSKGEVIWWIISGFATLIALLVIRGIFGTWTFLYLFTSWWAIPIWSIVLGYFGRSLANISPLKKETGEGSHVWIKLLGIRFLRRIDRVFRPRKVQLTQVITHKHPLSREARVVEGEVYIGTAPIPDSGLYAEKPVARKAGLPIRRQEMDFQLQHNTWELRPRSQPVVTTTSRR